MLPPNEHERICKTQEPLDLPQTAYGVERSQATMEKITRQLSGALAAHARDEADT